MMSLLRLTELRGESLVANTSSIVKFSIAQLCCLERSAADRRARGDFEVSLEVSKGDLNSSQEGSFDESLGNLHFIPGENSRVFLDVIETWNDGLDVDQGRPARAVLASANVFAFT